MARECSWSHDFIADNLTVQQLKSYYEIIQKQKLRETQLLAVVILEAAGTALGSVKYADFQKFLEKLKVEVKTTSLEEGIKKGLPIEER